MPCQNSKEETALGQFKKEVFNEGILHEGDTLGTDDETLLRFLRARKLNIQASKKMIKDCQEWRRTLEGVGIDELYKRIDPFDYPERKAVFDCWPMWFHKTDKQGRPLNVHFLGGMNLNKLYKECTPERHWQTVLVNAESLTREILPAASRKAGRPINNVFVIVDLKGFGISQFWQMKALAQRSFQISQDYYPETMGQLAIVNAPSSFTFIWSIIRPWLSKETAEKVDILGGDYKDVLLRLVDEDVLPSVLGGRCTCEGVDGAGADGNECHLSGAGPWLDGRVGWGPTSKSSTGHEIETRSTSKLDDVIGSKTREKSTESEKGSRPSTPAATRIEPSSILEQPPLPAKDNASDVGNLPPPRPHDSHAPGISSAIDEPEMAGSGLTTRSVNHDQDGLPPPIPMGPILGSEAREPSSLRC